MGKIAHIITHDFGRPSMNNLFEAIERSKIEQNLYKKYTSGNGHRNSIENEYCDPSDNTNSILDRYDNIIQLIIGISVPKSGLGKSHGAHVFIMYNVDPYNPARRWQDDIMLDTSGSFGNNTFRERLTDVLEPSIFFYLLPTTISIDAYRRYFFNGELNEIREMIRPGNLNEILYTYTFIIEETVGEIIKILIRNKSVRNKVACALEATEVLERSGLFPAIRVSRIPLVTRRPLRLKNFLDNYTTHNNRIIDLKEKSFYDLDIYP
jgi:hypothetical protein